MLKLFKINIINLILCLRLAELYSAAITDHSKDNSINNHFSINHLYDDTSNVIFNTDQYNANDHFKNHLNTQSHLEESIATANEFEYTTPYADPNFNWEKEIKTEKSEDMCLLDSLKLALMWWSYSNGSLRETNLHVLSPQQQLDLSYHNIGSDEEVLTLIPNISENMPTVAFSLAYNNLTSAPTQTLQMMANSLKYLSLMGNPFIDIKYKRNGYTNRHCILYEEDLEKFENQDSARLSTNGRESLAWATFPYMPSLLELDISDCYIEFIGKIAFTNLTNLKNLYMSHNKILTIPSDTFFYTPALQVLDLSFANIYDSFINRISASPNLELVMKFIYGINIEARVFKYLPKLKYLDLSHSKLSRSSAVAFTHIGASLKYLSLCYTSFSEFHKRIFKNSSLIGLDLSGNANAACNLSEDFFEGLAESLTYLFFENANLRDLSWVKPLHRLRVLALAGNNVNTLLAEHFMGLKQLQILDLTSNQIVNWYSRVFKYNENLRILSLRANNINVITSEMLKDISMLLYLSLGHNNFVCDCMLRDLVDMAAANNQQAQCKGNIWQGIRENIHITSVHLSQVLQNSKLFTNTSLRNLDIPSLVISQNLHRLKQSVKNFLKPINFTSERKIHFILDALRSYNSSKDCSHRNNSYESNYRSINSTLFSGKLQLLDYEDEHYWCYNETQRQNLVGLNCQRATVVDDIEQELNKLSTYILATVGSLTLMVIIGTIIYMKRWHIYYYYSSLKSAALLSVVSKDKLNKFNGLCEQNPSMVYDIFVSYCQSDRDWIVDEFMANIENTADISICLHERDFQVGVTILDNIVSCMERSKAIMLIISSNFLLSHWCQFEMQLAQHHILDLNKDNLILVLLEDIPRSKMPKNLQFLMKVKTYIKWPRSKHETNVQPEEYKLFWKRLKRSLRNIGVNPSQSKA